MGKQRNEGEGNRTAAKAYNKKTQQFAQSGRVKDAAEKAKHAFDGKEGEAMRRAEEEGKFRASEQERAPDRRH